MAQSCSNFRALLVADKDRDLLVARARCKMWSCPYCADVNRKQWRMRIYKAQDTLGEEWAFVTLTAHSKAHADGDTLNNLQNGWKRLSARMRRRWGTFAYVRVYERHESGEWHWHMLVNFHFDDIRIRKHKNGKETPYSPTLEKMARECSLGWYTHAENMRTVKGAAKYVTKYMSKSLEELPKGIRRIQTSQNFPELTNESEYDWSIRAALYERDLFHIEDRGGEMVDVSTGDKITHSYFELDPVYPPAKD